MILADEGKGSEKDTAARKFIVEAQKETDPQQPWNDNIASTPEATADANIADASTAGTNSTSADLINTAAVLWHGLTATAAAKYQA